MGKIDITSELERLDKHLAGNKRTILSAKFGDGKSYFLKEYVHTCGKEKLFITLHPVNYVVAPNEDIFEYIKRDILSFLSKQPEFKEVDWEKARKKILDYDTLLEECEFLSDAIPPAKILLTPFRLFKKVDNAYAIDKFFDCFASTKGGIFEQDEFTIAIQETIECIQQHGKECVLIIEDLDRIDPGHLFRILNVLGAHIDVEPDKNKFGFDNIILVLDFDVTRTIFYHFYGENANYEGYMAKFITGNPFYYSITEVARKRLYSSLLKYGVTANFMKYELVIDKKNEKMISLAQAMNSLSVRDVGRVLDGMATSSGKDWLVCNDHRYSPKSPILYLLATVSLLDIEIRRENLVYALKRGIEEIKMLGNFLLMVEGGRSGMFPIDGHWFEVVENVDNGNYSMGIQIMYGGSDASISLDKLINTALDQACDYVPDIRMKLV